MKATNSISGFTLMEVMIAVVLTGILLVAVYGTISSVARSSLLYQEDLSAKIRSIIEVDQILRFIRPARQVNLSGSGLEVVSSGIQTPGRPGLYRIRWRLDPQIHVLILDQQPLSQTDGQPLVRPILEGVSYVRWACWDGKAWVEHWDSKCVPLMIRMDLCIEPVVGKRFVRHQIVNLACGSVPKNG